MRIQLGSCTTGSASAISRAAVIPASDAANGTPPLLFHGGPVMMTQSTGPLIVTPIFWNPAGDPMSLAYKAIILKYLLAVSLASGQNSNVYSTLNEYSGTDGQIHYQVRLGLPVNDTDPLPASGCTVASTDTANIYGDGSGYNACLDDDQLQAEINHVTAWYNSSGFENGDECAYIFGATQGSAGHLYNQVIAGFHFLTQEEFSNKDFALTGGGCVQSASAEA